MGINVIKRSGKKEPLDLEKFHKVVLWACEGITGVSASEVEIKSQVQFYNNVKTSDIQETLIKAAADLISEETPNYQYVAGRLVNYHIRKQVFGGYELPHLLEHTKLVVKAGFYEPKLLEWYSEEDYNELNDHINHDRDFTISYAGMEEIRDKYIVKNRATGDLYETPQFAMMLIAMTFFHSYEKNRLKWVKEFYDALSTFDISLPTPIMAGFRTPQKQFSSCVLIESDDSLDSINAVSAAIVKYVSQKAGIGINGGRIRALGSPVRRGDTYHTGVIPFWKLFSAAVSSCSQGSVRKGSATLYYPFWHLEFEDIIVLKNNKGTEDNRIRRMDYGIQFNKLAYERLLAGGDITLFSPSDVPDLYEAFFVDNEKFKELYEKYERSRVRKKTIKAIDFFTTFMSERKDTGRIYIQNVDHSNDHGSFVKELAPIRQSNLCVEITLPTKPLQKDPTEGRIALCTLGAVNWGKIREPADFKKPCELLVRALDALLTYQDYPVEEARLSNDEYRPLGIGIINFAHWLAKNDLNYQDIDEEGLQKVHYFAEAWSYYLIKASADLAEEYGEPYESRSIKYSQGVLPIDTYKPEVDSIVKPIYNMPWNDLREQLLTTGIRNATLMALMPSESSSVVSNSTNGIEPPRSLVTEKISKGTVVKQVVPQISRLKNKYDLLWDQKSPQGYLKICAVLQKFIDQAISVNTSYNPKFFPEEKIPMSVMLQDLLLHYKLGGKTAYYFNTNDGAGELEVKLDAAAPIDEDCESCKI